VGTDCTELYNSSCINYTGVAIPCLNITTGMNLTAVIQNMAIKLCETCAPQPFVCPDCVGNEVVIGTQTWTECNLNVTTYANGDPIPEVTDPTAWAALTTGAWCYYNNDPANGPIYGKLYNWYAVNDPRGLAPIGYHVPSDAEWTTLTTFLGGESFAGGAMKTTGTLQLETGCWETPNVGATNSSGFKGQPGGGRYNYGFDTISIFGSWWTSTEIGPIIEVRSIENPSDNVGNSSGTKELGFSVRLIKDYEIGDLAHGGVVAYILEEGDDGYNENVQHGLIATVADISAGAEWGCEGVLIGSDGLVIGTGNQNTEDIVAICNTAGIAARLCSNLNQGGYSDWYLPSRDELNQLYINRVAIGGFSTSNYWSSSEDTSNGVWYQDFSDGSTNDQSKTILTSVRAVRTF
jgi:uncharacterized protein (TIGR02145 family)